LSGVNILTKILRKFAIASVLLVPIHAAAESNFQTGSSSLTATAHLDFRITIPNVLFLQVSAGTASATNATIDLIDFTVPAANLGNGAAVAATVGSGDLGNGTVTARVIGNNGTVTFTSTTLGALSNGSGDAISYSQIATATATATTGTILAHPALADGAATSITLTPVGKIVNQDAKWTYTYKNQSVVAPGTYGGVNVNNSRVTYTASMP
jgi:hypothetical protein